VGQPSYLSYWDSFGPMQCYYNLFYDKWDLCEAFDPTSLPDGGDEDWDIDNVNQPDFLNLGQEDPCHHNHMEGAYTSKSDLQWIYDIDHTAEGHDDEAEFKDILPDVAYYHFGFMNLIWTVNEPASKPHWDTVLYYLGSGQQAMKTS
jgi:hypothetical protein